MATCCLSFSRRGGTLPPRVTSWPCTRGKAQERLWDQPDLPLPSSRASGVERSRQRPGKAALLGPQPPPPTGPGGRGPPPPRWAARSLGDPGGREGPPGLRPPHLPKTSQEGMLRGVQAFTPGPLAPDKCQPAGAPCLPACPKLHGGWGAASTLGLGRGASVRSRGFHLRLWLGQGGRGGRKMATPDHHLSPEAKKSQTNWLKENQLPFWEGCRGGNSGLSRGSCPAHSGKGRRTGVAGSSLGAQTPGRPHCAPATLAPRAPAGPYPGARGTWCGPH